MCAKNAQTANDVAKSQVDKTVLGGDALKRLKGSPPPFPFPLPFEEVVVSVVAGADVVDVTSVPGSVATAVVLAMAEVDREEGITIDKVVVGGKLVSTRMLVATGGVVVRSSVLLLTTMDVVDGAAVESDDAALAALGQRIEGP